MITYELTPDLKRLIDSGADGGNGEFEPFLPPKLAEIAGKSNISFMPQIVRSRAYGEDRVAWVQVNNESRDIVEKSIDQLTEQEPTSVLDSLKRQYGDKMTRNTDGTVDIDGDVNLSSLDLEELPVRFGRVTGDFDCSFNRLTSLIGTPRYVGGDFDCSGNRLTSFIGAPMRVDGQVDLLYNDFSGEEVEAYLKRIEKARKVEGMTAPTKDPVEEAIDMVMKESITDITSFSDETKRKYWTKYRELTRRGIPHTRAQQEAYEYAVSN